MADIRIKDLPTTATQTASDDFIALDGTVNGTRKIDASAPSFKTSVTSPSVVAPAATALTLTGGSTGASLVLGASSGASSLTGTGNVKIGFNAASGALATFGVSSGSAVDGPYLQIRGKNESGTEGWAQLILNSSNAAASSGSFQINQYDGASFNEVLRTTKLRNLLIGTTTDISGSGGLFASGRVAIGSATDLYLTRTNAGMLQLNTTTGTIPILTINHVDNGGQAIITLKNPTQTWDIRNTGSSFAIRESTLGNYPFEMDAGALSSGSVYINKTTAASSTTTGALRVAGGVGVSGAGYFGGGLNVTSTAAQAGLSVANSAANIPTIYLRQNDSATGDFTIQNKNATSGYVSLSAGGGVDGLRIYPTTGNAVVVSTTSASSSTVGALTIGNGSAATNVAIGAGVIYAGSKISVNNSGLGGVRLGVTSTTGGEIGVYADSSATTGANIGMASAPAGVGATSNTGFWANPIAATNNIGFLAGNITPPAVTASFYGTNKIITTDATPSTGSTSGALQVAGGIYAGDASVFGSTVTLPATGDLRYGTTLGSGFVTIGDAGTFTLRNASADAYLTANNSSFNVLRAATFSSRLGVGVAAHASIQLNVNQATSNSPALWTQSPTTVGQSQGIIINAGTNASDYGLLVRNAAQTDMFRVDGTGAATFAGIIKPQQATTAGAPAYVKGAIYFDTTLNKLRVGGATAWETITSV